MDWGSIGTALASIGLPMLGAALPIPGGAALGKMLADKLTGNADASTDDMLLALATPEAQQAAREFASRHEETILRINVQAETAQIESVNATMRAEAGAANWPTWTWRPFIGFVFGTMIFGDYFLLPLLHIQPPAIPSEVFMAIMAILGVASWGHSKAMADPSNTAVTRG